MALVLTEIEDGVATVTLNHPEVRNAVSLDMNRELDAVFDRLEADESVGAVVLTGAPPAFSAGANLDELLAADDPESLGIIYAGFLRVAHTPLPTVAAVNGATVGAGMNFALACDVILAGRSAMFESRFLQIAIHPGGGAHLAAAEHLRPPDGHGHGAVRRAARRPAGRGDRAGLEMCGRRRAGG